MADSNVYPKVPVDGPLERSLYIGTVLRGMLYGIEVFAFFASIYCISRRSPEYRKRQKFYIVYGAILLVLITIQVACDMMWGAFMWIAHSNDPGGPLGFYGTSAGAWYNAVDFTSHATANLLADGLLLYRYSIICGSQWRILVLPIVLYVASSVVVFMMVIERILQHHAHIFYLHGKPMHPLVLWVSLSVALNIIITSMICFRVLRMRALTRKACPLAEPSRMYTSIATVLLESAAPFTIVGISLVIVAAGNGPLVDAFCYVWSVFCSLSPQMIILRVAMGRGWLKETANELSSALESAQAATLQEQSQGAFMPVTICVASDPISSPRTPESDMSNPKDMNKTDVVSVV